MNWIGVAGIALSVFITGFNAALFCVVKFNDLAHLAKDVTEIKNSIKEIEKSMVSAIERVAKIEGKCAANHK